MVAAESASRHPGSDNAAGVMADLVVVGLPPPRCLAPRSDCLWDGPKRRRTWPSRATVMAVVLTHGSVPVLAVAVQRRSGHQHRGLRVAGSARWAADWLRHRIAFSEVSR